MTIERTRAPRAEREFTKRRLISTLPDVSPHFPAYATYRTKRVVDVALCVLGFPFALAIGILCAVAILIDSRGPILFIQHRTGLHSRRFRMLKFRTMVRNAEDLKASLVHRSEVAAPDFKLSDDPRVTRVGKLLRKTGLDELPQIINVLRGDMSLVGPRPTSFDANTYDTWHLARLGARPGITGLWQVENRNSEFDDRVRYDLKYMETMSLLGDIRILLRTIATALRREGT